MNVSHVIAGLEQGGAEAVLFRLIECSSPTIKHTVVSLMGDGHYGPRLRKAGVTVHTIGMPQGRVTGAGMLALRRILKTTNPDVVQTWMYHADLLGGIAARWAGVRAIAWGIRHSNLDRRTSSLSARVAMRICALLSRWLPSAIVCNSNAGALVHKKIGYEPGKFLIIRNGFDLNRFAPDAALRDSLRSQWNASPSTALIGMVARWHPHKDHETLVKALGHLRRSGIDFQCVLVGKGMTRDNGQLVDLLRRFGVDRHVVLAGPRDDIASVMNALDLHVLSSESEAFPNTVAEAMACGTPCVVTDVGDASSIVGPAGWVVPPRHPEALASGIQSALSALAGRGREEISRMCRSQIAENFDIKQMVSAYEAFWADLALRKAMRKAQPVLR